MNQNKKSGLVNIYLVAIVAIILLLIFYFGGDFGKEASGDVSTTIQDSVEIYQLDYDLNQISEHKTKYIGNTSKVGSLVLILPTPDSAFVQNFFSLGTRKKPYSLTVYYELAPAKMYSGKWPIVTPNTYIENNSRINALVLFSMVDNLEMVTFAFRNSHSEGELDSLKYETRFTFPRASFENEYGELSELRDNLNSLNDAIIKERDKNILEKDQEVSKGIKELVENNLNIIISTPLESSNPEEYIMAHREEYENILKYGDEAALKYMLSQFAKGESHGLRGQIMMHLSKEILGVRNNIKEDSLSPEEWYDRLKIRQERVLPDYIYDGQDTVEKLVYETEIDRAKNNDGGFVIVAPHIFGAYEEKNKLKVIVTTYSKRYKLYDKFLSEEGGSITPAAITYLKNPDGTYILCEYREAGDGSNFASSIKEFCTMPVSGDSIEGLPDQIIKHYRDCRDLFQLENKNLKKHIEKYAVDLEVLQQEIKSNN